MLLHYIYYGTSHPWFTDLTEAMTAIGHSCSNNIIHIHMVSYKKSHASEDFVEATYFPLPFAKIS